MGGSEEIYRSQPRFANVGYLPNDMAQAGLVMRMAEEQQARIHELGNNMAQGAAILPTAAVNAFNSFNEGRHMRQSEEQAQQNYDLNAKRGQAMDLDMQARRGQMSEDEMRRKLEYGGDGMSGTAATRAADAHASNLLGMDATKHSMQTEDQRLALEGRRLGLDSQTAAFNLGQAKNLAEVQKLQATVGGIQNDPNLTPEQKKVKIAQVQSEYSSRLGNADYAAGLGSQASIAAQAAANQAAAGNRTVLESQSAFQTLKPIADKTNANIAAVKSLDDLAKQYESGLRSWVPGALGGAGAESSVASSAREAAAQAADSIQPGLGASIRNSSLEGVKERIQAVKKIAAQHVKTNWEAAKGSIPPQVTNLAEFQQAENAVRSISEFDTGGSEKNKKDLGPASPGGRRSVADVLRGGAPQAPAGQATAAPGAPVPPYPQAIPQPQPAVAPPQPGQAQPIDWRQWGGR